MISMGGQGGQGGQGKSDLSRTRAHHARVVISRQDFWFFQDYTLTTLTNGSTMRDPALTTALTAP
jgi:hypothetical protein